MASIKELVPETHHDLLDAKWATALVTLDDEGRPHTTAVWYLADDEDGQLKTSISDARLKFKHIQANPEVDFFVVDPANQFHTLEIRATAEIKAEDGTAGKIGAKYGANVADYDAPEDTRYAIYFTPRKVVTNG